MQNNLCVIGRFQPFHWGHFDYIMMASLIPHDNLIIGITNPDEFSLYSHESNTNRCLAESNPFTYEERHSMIQETLKFLSPHITHIIRPCVLGRPEKIISSLGKDLIIAVTTYDKWGDHRITLFKNAGYKVKVLWKRNEKITTGSEIRNKIRDNEEWEHLVPNGCKEILKKILSERKI